MHQCIHRLYSPATHTLVEAAKGATKTPAMSSNSLPAASVGRCSHEHLRAIRGSRRGTQLAAERSASVKSFRPAPPARARAIRRPQWGADRGRSSDFLGLRPYSAGSYYCRFPDGVVQPPFQCQWLRFVPSYRCGAVPDSHRDSLLGPICCTRHRDGTQDIVFGGSRQIGGLI